MGFINQVRCSEDITERMEFLSEQPDSKYNNFADIDWITVKRIIKCLKRIDNICFEKNITPIKIHSYIQREIKRLGIEADEI